MKVLIDLNILLDISLNRKEFLNESAQLLTKAIQNSFEGFISAISVPTFYYIIQKEQNKTKAISDLKHYLTFLKIAEVNQNIIELALSSEFPDYEDAIQYFSALELKCELIITRNIRDFKKSILPVLTPKEYMKMYMNS